MAYLLFLGAKILNCSKSETYFVKIFGTKTSNLDNPMLLYEGEPLSPITEECLAKCLDNDQCLDFVLYYNASICYWYKNSRKPVDDFKDIADPNAVWFSKTCLRGKPNYCFFLKNSWQLVRKLSSAI